MREGTDFGHQTKAGPIHLEVRRGGSGRWLARYWGEQVEGGREFRSFKEAKGWILRCFQELFPEHRYGRGCSERVDKATRATLALGGGKPGLDPQVPSA
jgi:hypothetical protein